ncbi:hypothetical protein NIES2101_26835 [Calothrix sp. HK-06]|nr:hypothetical protein NIES2101_26835 [Calothrix sp. HK-06]
MNPPPIYKFKTKQVAPREFLRSLLIGNKLEEIEYLKAEMQRGYKTQCTKILSCLLGTKKSTILNRWGTLEFEEMPEYYKQTLGYICAAGINSTHAHQIIKGTYIPQTISAQEFLEYALALSSLSSSERDIRLSRHGFFNECVRVLATVTGFEPTTVALWGNDIRFHRMPSEHERTLYYAQAAMKVLNQTTQQLIAA